MEANLSVAHRYQIPTRTRWSTFSALALAVVAAMNPAVAYSQTRGPVDRTDRTGKNLEVLAVRTRIATDDGALIIYDAPRAEGEPPGHAGYIAYWRDFAADEVFVYGHVIEKRSDVVHALLWLRHDFGIDPHDLSPDAFPVDLPDASEVNSMDPAAPRAWYPATRRNVMMIAGLWELGEFDKFDESGPPPVIARPPCIPCAAVAAGGSVVGGDGNDPTGADLPSDPYEAGVLAVCDCCLYPEPCPPSCEDYDACTRDYYDRNCYFCYCVNQSRTCYDDNKCTYDSCNRFTGACDFQPKNCDDDDPCTDDSCVLPDGNCVHTQRCEADACCNGHCRKTCETNCCGTAWFKGECCGSTGSGCGLNQICCNGLCCGGECSEASCADGECVTTPACDDGDPCTNDICTFVSGTCGDFTCANPLFCTPGKCCPADTGHFCAPAGGVCCSNPDHPCNAGQTCCGAGCCSTGTHCCDPATGRCCPDELECCPNSIACCPAVIDCCGNGCCASTQFCCPDDETCCALGVQCCNTSTGCCQSNEYCCPTGDRCCPLGEDCCVNGCCPAGQICYEGTTCCDPQFWCDNNECCYPLPCEGCWDNGELSVGAIDVQPPVVCVGDTITFTVSGVIDTRGGVKRVFCSAKQEIPAVTPTYTWTLTIPPDYPPPLPPLTGSGPVASVTANAPGTYSVTFTATANRECPPSPITIGPETVDTCQSGFAVAAAEPTCGLTVTLKEITFGDDHTVFEEAPPCRLADPTSCWGAGAALTGVDWASVNNPDHPICYTRSTGMRLTVQMDVTGSGGGIATLRVVGPDGVTGEGTFSVPCGTETKTVTIVTSNLPSVVKAYTPTGLSWSVQPPGATAFSPIGATSHRIYVTFGNPTGSEPTNRRLNFVCYAAAQAGTGVQTTDGVEPFGGTGIHSELDDDPPEDGKYGTIPAWDQMWKLMAGLPYTGECHQQAHLMNLAVQLIGVGAGREYKLRASTDAIVDEADGECRTAAMLGITEDLDGDGEIGEESLCLYFDFLDPPDPPLSHPNAFEGTLEMPWGHYSVWPSFKASTGCRLLLLLLTPDPTVGWDGAKQYWMLTSGNTVLYVRPGEEQGPASCP